MTTALVLLILLAGFVLGSLVTLANGERALAVKLWIKARWQAWRARK
jgi:hypothetical protein